MIGRAAIGYPWIFNEMKHYFTHKTHLPAPDLFQRVEAARQHLLWAIEWKGEHVGIVEMRRHYANYFKGIPDFKPYRQQLVTLNDLGALLEVFEQITTHYTPEGVYLMG